MFSVPTCLLALQLATLGAAWLPRDRNYFKQPLGEIHDPFLATHTTNTSSPKYDGSVTGAEMGGYHKSDNRKPSKERRQIYSQEIRGVNLGSSFIIEPWMASNTWNNMGCGNAASEFDCVLKLGQSQANSVFQNHWNTWITDSDLANMQSYGLNSIRIPVGYWIYEDIVDANSEHFPQGGLAYLDRLVGWASNRNMYIVLDLHGAPGAQDPYQPFTGQNAPSAGFFDQYNYNRAEQFLTFFTNRIHTNNNYRGCGAIEVLNEPQSGHGDLVTNYYPNAMNTVRQAESNLGISASNGLHVIMMDNRWGAGDPNAAMSGGQLTNAGYDDHRYLKYDTSVPTTQDGYLSASCHDDVSGNWPLIVGEWSISVADSVQWNSDFDPSTQQNFYRNWFAAQVMAYEKQDGWMFWSWKTELGDYRWDYQAAVQAGVIPSNPSDVYNYNACSGR